EATLNLATAQQFSVFEAFATSWRGWAQAVGRRDPAGLQMLRSGMASLAAAGHTQSQPFYSMLLAEAADHVGQGQDVLLMLANAGRVLETNGQREMLSEAYRLQGALLRGRPSPDLDGAEACFQRALGLAREQEARSWELRAALSLGRLWLR